MNYLLFNIEEMKEELKGKSMTELDALRDELTAENEEIRELFPLEMQLGKLARKYAMNRGTIHLRQLRAKENDVILELIAEEKECR